MLHYSAVFRTENKYDPFLVKDEIDKFVEHVRGRVMFVEEKEENNKYLFDDGCDAALGESTEEEGEIFSQVR